MANDVLEGLLARNLSNAERLINALRSHIGDDDPKEGYEFHDEELYLFLLDGDRLLKAMGIDYSLTFASDAISIGGTITKPAAILMLFSADYLLWRRLEREGTRRAVSIREMDTAIDTREIARSAAAGMKERWIQLNDTIKEVRRGDITPTRINNYVQRNFPDTDQSFVDETRGDSAERV